MDSVDLIQRVNLQHNKHEIKKKLQNIKDEKEWCGEEGLTSRAKNKAK